MPGTLFSWVKVQRSSSSQLTSSESPKETKNPTLKAWAKLVSSLWGTITTRERRNWNTQLQKEHKHKHTFMRQIWRLKRDNCDGKKVFIYWSRKVIVVDLHYQTSTSKLRMLQSSTGHRSKTRQTTKMGRFSLSRSNLRFVILALSILCKTSSVYGSEEKKLDAVQEKVLVKANDHAPLPTHIQGKFFVKLVVFEAYTYCVFRQVNGSYGPCMSRKVSRTSLNCRGSYVMDGSVS